MLSVDRLEDELAAIWKDVLEVPQVESTDDFFGLGGTSLLALRISAHIAETLNIAVSPLMLFDNPTVSDLAHTLTNLEPESTKKAPKLRWSLRPKRGGASLSRLQLATWCGCISTPGAIPHSADTFKITGHLDVPRLEKACAEIIRRHPILRSAFPRTGDLTDVRHAPSGAFKLQRVDLTNVSSSSWRDELISYIRQIREAPFDLETGPLVRLSLIAIGRNSHVFLIVVHELVCDLWSLELLIHELEQGYNAGLTQTTSALKSPAPQFEDAVRSRGLNLPSRTIYWDDMLTQAPLTLPFPFDSGGFASVASSEDPAVALLNASVELPAGLLTDLQALATCERCTPLMLHMAAFFVLLNRYTAEEDLIINSHAANRLSTDQEKTVGYFAYVLPTWLKVDGEATFRTLLGRMRQRMLDLLTNADNSLDGSRNRLRAVGGIRGLNTGKVIFRHFSKSQLPIPRLHGLRTSRAVPFAEAGTLVMHVHEQAGQSTTVTLSSEAISQDAVEMMLGHYRQLLGNITDDPDLQIQELDVLSRREERALASTWSRSQSTDVEQSVPALLRSSFEPDATAIRAGSNELSYSDLIIRAQLLAGRLAERGVGADDVVGVAMPASPESIVAMLAVLLTGAAYLAIDDIDRADMSAQPSAWPSMEALIVSDFTPPAQLMANHVIDLAHEPVEVDISTPPQIDIELDKPAVVLMSAGVTGPPKFVPISHRVLTQSAAWQQRTYQLRPTDRVFHQPGPGALAWSLSPWASLISGAEVICPSQSAVHAASMASWLESQAVTVATIPAAMATDVLSSGQASSLSTLVISGSDPVTAPPHLKVFRQYAIAEAGGPTLSTRVEDPDDAQDGVVIGGPHDARTTAYVLDRARKMLPVGAVGELYVGGDGIAQTYVDELALAEQTFIDDPFGQAEGEHIAKTGDLARRRGDGTIELLGRVSDQVHFRGFRLNPRISQLEQTLARHPAVSVAGVRWDSETLSLTAYIVPSRSQLPLPRDLNYWVTRRSNVWLLPAQYLAVEQIPTRPDGTVDRKALTHLAGVLMENSSPSTQQKNIERQLTRIWEKLLKHRRIGSDENFYDIGGDTVLSFEMLSRANKAGIPLTPFHLSLYPTIGELAAAVNQG